MASSFERVGNVFHWKVPFSSKVAIIALLVVTLLLYLIPLRAIVLFWGLNKVKYFFENSFFIKMIILVYKTINKAQL